MKRPPQLAASSFDRLRERAFLASPMLKRIHHAVYRWMLAVLHLDPVLLPLR
jgi:hypothetical protein